MSTLTVLDLFQLMLNAVGIGISISQLMKVYRDDQNRKAAKLNGSLHVVSTIRGRRERSRLWKHAVAFGFGIYVLYWHAHGEVQMNHSAIARDLTVIFITIILIRESILSIFDRRRVAEAKEAEGYGHAAEFPREKVE
jgi:hypothetical protein